MRLRTSITLALALVSLVPLLGAPLALRDLEALLNRQQQGQIAASVETLKSSLARVYAEVERAMDELEASPDLEKAIGELGQSPVASRGLAEALMAPRSLGVLSLFDSQGKTLSCGHLPARLGDPDETLFAATKQAGGRAALVEVATAEGLERVPAWISARPIDYGERRLWIVGGVRLDAHLARELARLSNGRVEIVASTGASVAEGEAAPPTVLRSLPLGDVATVRIHFSRAGLVEAVSQVRKAFLGFFGVGLLAAMVFGVVIARRMTRPIEALTEAASSIASGSLDARVTESASGEVGELVEVFNRMTSDLRQTTEQLLATERIAAWQEVARRLAHEIKNPLTPIRMSLETLLAAGAEDSPHFRQLFRESAGVILEEVERLRRIVDEFSRFARLPKPKLEPFALAPWLGQVLSLYGAPRPGIQLERNLSLEVSVRGDRDQLTQVLVNLLKNAEEAIAGPGRIEVRALQAGAEVAIEVEDNGPGIPAELRARIFEPYFTTKSGGSGLGLAIAARICQEHGGRLEVRGATADPSGRGAVFTLYLPRVTP